MSWVEQDVIHAVDRETDVLRGYDKL